MYTKICSYVSYYCNQTATNLLSASGLKGKCARTAKAVFGTLRDAAASVRSKINDNFANRVSANVAVNAVGGAMMYLYFQIGPALKDYLQTTTQQAPADQDDGITVANACIALTLSTLAITVNDFINRRKGIVLAESFSEGLGRIGLGVVQGALIMKGTQTTLTYFVTEKLAQNLAYSIGVSTVLTNVVGWSVLFPLIVATQSQRQYPYMHLALRPLPRDIDEDTRTINTFTQNYLGPYISLVPLFTVLGYGAVASDVLWPGYTGRFILSGHAGALSAVGDLLPSS